jgi:hypothetical protein
MEENETMAFTEKMVARYPVLRKNVYVHPGSSMHRLLQPNLLARQWLYLRRMGITALFWAARGGSKSVVRLLLKSGANLF